MRRIFKYAAIAVTALLPFQAYPANTSSTDYSDLWWNPAESGWGVNIANQGDVIFMTLFVYGEGQQAKWYVGPALTTQGGATPVTYSGDFYETTGPASVGEFDPASVVRRWVGSATIAFPSGTVGQLSYAVDGAFVTKRIERQTFRSNELSGSYHGSMVGERVLCSSGTGSFANATQFLVSHAGTAIKVVAFVNNFVQCTYDGAYSQSGRMGTINGTVSCQDGGKGTFQAFEVEAGQVGFSGRYRADYGNGCIESGRIGAIR